MATAVGAIQIRDSWTKLYRFDLSEQVLAITSKAIGLSRRIRNSIFVNGLMAARAEPDRRYALRNNELAVHRLDGRTERRRSERARAA